MYDEYNMYSQLSQKVNEITNEVSVPDELVLVAYTVGSKNLAIDILEATEMYSKTIITREVTNRGNILTCAYVPNKEYEFSNKMHEMLTRKIGSIAQFNETERQMMLKRAQRILRTKS